MHMEMQSEKATYCIIPTILHLKRQNYRDSETFRGSLRFWWRHGDKEVEHRVLLEL